MQNKQTAALPDQSVYQGSHLNRVAFPLGGIGAGMISLEGTGALSHVSLRHRPEVTHEPQAFAALHVKGAKTARYDAVAQVLHLHPAVGGDFRAFLCTATGYATVGVRRGKPFCEVVSGMVPVQRMDYTPAPLKRRSLRKGIADNTQGKR